MSKPNNFYFIIKPKQTNKQTNLCFVVQRRLIFLFGTLTDLSSYICDDIKNPEISNLKEIEGAFTKWSLSNPLSPLIQITLKIPLKYHFMLFYFLVSVLLSVQDFGGLCILRMHRSMLFCSKISFLICLFACR